MHTNNVSREEDHRLFLAKIRLDYDGELRRPFPSQPQFAPDSEVWRREHAIAAEHGTYGRNASSAASRAQSLEFQ